MNNVVTEINEFFRELKFTEDTHTYNVGNRNLVSVSGLIKDFAEKFDSSTISRQVAQKKGVTQKEVLKDWDNIRIEATTRGHRVHDFGERYVWDRSLQPTCGQEVAVTKFWNELPDYVVPVTMELKMFHKELYYAGTADIILYNTRTQQFIIADYKTNKDLFKNFKGKRLKHPFGYLLDSPFNKYQLQLSFYQMLFQQTGYKVSSRKIIWLRPDATYNIYDTEDFTKELAYYMIKRN